MRFINPETFEDWKDRAEQWGYGLESNADGYLALDKQGKIAGVWSKAGEEWLRVGRRSGPNGSKALRKTAELTRERLEYFHKVMGRGGAGRGQGRKPLAKTGELMKPRQMRMTDAEWDKCKRLGGASWVRAKIKAAK